MERRGEPCAPNARPVVRRTAFSSESAKFKLDERTTYNLQFASKLGAATGRQHNSGLKRVDKYIPDFSSSPGFILTKQYNAPEDSGLGGGKRSKMTGLGAGTPSKNVSQFIALTLEMIAAIFNPEYVSSLKKFIEEEIESGAGVDDGVFEERIADKPAIRFPPPFSSGGKQKQQQLGTLSVGVGVSNYNLIRHSLSEGEFQFAEEDGSDRPQLLCQINMTDTKSSLFNVPPLARFSAPAAHMIKILENDKFLQLIRSRCPDFPSGPASPGPDSESD